MARAVFRPSARRTGCVRPGTDTFVPAGCSGCFQLASGELKRGLLMPKKRNGLRPTGLLVGASLCFASLASVPFPALAQTCQAGQPGCLLPVGEAPPPVTTTTTQQPVYVDEGGGGIGLLPILIGLAALGALLYFLVLDDDDNEEPISP